MNCKSKKANIVGFGLLDRFEQIVKSKIELAGDVCSSVYVLSSMDELLKMV